jgi:hypothetical protein
MISTAIAIQDATKNAVMHDVTMSFARDIFDNKDMMGETEFAKAIYQYSAHLSALTATLVMEACLTKSQLDEMMDTVKEMQSMGKDLDSE